MLCLILFCLLTSLTAELLVVAAKPSCQASADNPRDIVCTPGTSDYLLERGLVSDNNRTTRITLRACRITDVDFGSFSGLPALEYLDLSQNKIVYLKLGVLDEFTQLKFFNLSHNQLTGFPLGIFDQKPNMEVLDLKGNKITELELGIFDLMKKLRHVDVSSNALLGKEINSYIFDQSTKIKIMDFSRNDMSDSKSILLDAFEMLEFLNLDRCLLTEVPVFATKPNLKTMKHLILSTNKITRLDDRALFINLENLEILNLVDNAIEHIADKVFMSLKKLKSVLLRGNKLTQIPGSLFQHLPKLISVDLSHNLIEFVPVNAFRGSPVKNLNLSVNRFTYLTDNFCLELRNSGGGMTKFYFNQNPWQCACLRDILDEVKKFGIKYNGVGYDGRTPVCVISNDFNCRRQPDANANFVDLYYELIRKE
ncbi:carboxypeptidase N subunit 2-like [Ostrinia nubilalis]|uniref:carboxypeptidase N subunit 2-like n=1 Tax=Ostrinia nubilalis TaxID=29057 RepID=UPI00308252ED